MCETDLLKLARLAETAALYPYETTKKNHLWYSFQCTPFLKNVKKPTVEDLYQDRSYSTYLNNQESIAKQNDFINEFTKVYQGVHHGDNVKKNSGECLAQAKELYLSVISKNPGDLAIGEQFRTALKETIFHDASIKHDNYAQYATNLISLGLYFAVSCIVVGTLGSILSVLFTVPALTFLTLGLVSGLSALAGLCIAAIGLTAKGILEYCMACEEGTLFFTSTFYKILPKDTRPRMPSTPLDMNNITDHVQQTR